MLSIAGHGVVLAAILLTSAQHVSSSSEGVSVTFFAQAPRAASPAPAALGPAPSLPPAAEKPAAPRVHRVAARVPEPTPVATTAPTQTHTAEPTPTTAPTTAATQATAALAATSTGTGTSGGANGTSGSGTGAGSTGTGSGQGTRGGTGTGAGSSSNKFEVLPFGAGMERPRKISGGEITVTPEARAMHVSGLMIIKCVITTGGSLTGCQIIKGLPHMNEAALATMSKWRYSPVLYQGRPVNVSYIFNIKVVLPGG